MTPAEFRDRRLSLGLSVRGAAAYLDVAPSSITRWESGKHGIPSVIADNLAAASGTVRGAEPVDTGDAAQAEALGRALALLQEIADLPELPLSVSHQFGSRALAIMTRISHQPQNAMRRREREVELGNLLYEIVPEWLAEHGVFSNELQGSAWLGYYHQRRQDSQANQVL